MSGTLAETTSEEVALEDVIVEDAFKQRLSRPADLLRENAGLKELARQFAENPDGILDRLVHLALSLTEADSAGVSLLETSPDGTEVFRRAALAGEVQSNPETTTPAEFSPCATCLARRSPTLFAWPERYFTWMRRFGAPVVEGLVAPLRVSGKDIGTVWVMLHSSRKQFDAEDVRILESAADFAIPAYQLQTAREAAEHGEMERRVMEQRLRLALDSANLLAWEWSPERGKIFRSGNVAKVLGTASTEGSPDSIRFEQLIHPDDRETVAAAVEAGLRGEPYNCEYRIKLHDGTVRWMCDRGAVEPHGAGEPQRFSGVLADVTEQKRAGIELETAHVAIRRTHELFQRVLESIPSGSINVFDRDLRYVLAAGKGLRSVGLSSSDLVGKTINELFPEELARYVVPFYKRAFLGETVRFELAFGEQVFLIDSGPLTEQGGAITSIVAVAEDITERKRAEEVLLKQAEELARSNADLQQFAYVTSHDLQEPLRTIIAFSQLIALRPASEADPEQMTFLRHISEAGSRMKELISSLLEYSNVASAETPRPIPVDMTAALDWAKMNLNAVIEETGAVVTSDPLPCVTGVQIQLVRLLQNLIGNAIKYRSDATPEIQVGVEKRSDEWLFWVRDNGVGIEKDYFESIFGVFKRLHGRQIPGTGIGLAICKRIVERHGGRIRVESVGPGRGSTFYFSLPRSKDVPQLL